MPAHGVAHGSRVDARRHVVSGETGRTGACGTVGAELEQRLDRYRVPLFSGPHQRGRAAQLFRGVHVGAGSHEPLDRFGIAIARGIHQQRLAIRPALSGVGARVQQPVDDRGIAVQRSHGHRRHALAIPGIHGGARANQQIRGLEVVAVDRPMQRGGAIDLRRLHVGLLLQQRAESGLVALHHGVGDVAAARRGNEHARHDPDHRNAAVSMFTHGHT